jgi:hypothetical protein
MFVIAVTMPSFEINKNNDLCEFKNHRKLWNTNNCGLIPKKLRKAGQ